MTTFGALVRSYRLRAGLGLRTFAALIDERASVVSAVESHRRAPWRSAATLHRVAEVLGLPESSNLWQKILQLAQKNPTPRTRPHAPGLLPTGESAFSGRLTHWITSDQAPRLDAPSLAELATFVGANTEFDSRPEQPNALPPLTELAIEWRVRRLLGRREAQATTAPIDVEAALENEAGVRLEIVPGLVPRFSVQACAVETATGTTYFIDRIVADSRPLAAYRHLLARCYAPQALWQTDSQSGSSSEDATDWQAADYLALQDSAAWPQRLRDCERFALAMLLPANPVLAGAENAYTELVQQQGWVEIEDAARAVRNRLAEQFAVPTSLVHRRLLGWPCHLYGRIAQALAAQEPTLPPADWIADEHSPRQRTLFDIESQVVK